MWVYIVSAGAWEAGGAAPIPLEMGIQVVVSPTRVLGTGFGFSERAVHDVNHCAVSPAQGNTLPLSAHNRHLSIMKSRLMIIATPKVPHPCHNTQLSVSPL